MSRRTCLLTNRYKRRRGSPLNLTQPWAYSFKRPQRRSVAVPPPTKPQEWVDEVIREASDFTLRLTKHREDGLEIEIARLKRQLSDITSELERTREETQLVRAANQRWRRQARRSLHMTSQFFQLCMRRLNTQHVLMCRVATCTDLDEVEDCQEALEASARSAGQWVSQLRQVVSDSLVAEVVADRQLRLGALALFGDRVHEATVLHTQAVRDFSRGLLALNFGEMAAAEADRWEVDIAYAKDELETEFSLLKAVECLRTQRQGQLATRSAVLVAGQDDCHESLVEKTEVARETAAQALVEVDEALQALFKTVCGDDEVVLFSLPQRSDWAEEAAVISRVSEVRQALLDLRRQVAQQRGPREERRVANQQRIARMQEECESLRQAVVDGLVEGDDVVVELTRDINELKSTLADMSQEVRLDLENERLQLNSDVQTLQQKKTAAELDLVSLREARESLLRDIAESEQNGEVEELNARKAELATQREGLHVSRKQMESEELALRGENEVLKLRMADLAKKKADLESVKAEEETLLRDIVRMSEATPEVSPTGEYPAEDIPAEDSAYEPAKDIHAVESPAEDITAYDPAGDIPVVESPAEGIPKVESSAEDIPKVESSAEDIPKEESSAKDIPAEDSAYDPARNLPVVECPADTNTASEAPIETPQKKAETVSTSPDKTTSAGAESESTSYRRRRRVRELAVYSLDWEKARSDDSRETADPADPSSSSPDRSPVDEFGRYSDSEVERV
ncbi:MAG: hypothetical protein KVP17_001743 [Porospora cf. gigantea B]|uniref:uncharacterized protein n=2 Tax=Porospora cf. gigantea B TaxID=2853592 RepID=UPI003571E36A|nr:MAG: hypothetical protein KVP17_001743 [Porospora cf. gigantea B]